MRFEQLDFFDSEEFKQKESVCRKCTHSQGWECGSKTIYYCKVIPCGRTENGLKKIKLKDRGNCEKFEEKER